MAGRDPAMASLAADVAKFDVVNTRDNQYGTAPKQPQTRDRSHSSSSTRHTDNTSVNLNTQFQNISVVAPEAKRINELNKAARFSVDIFFC